MLKYFICAQLFLQAFFLPDLAAQNDSKELLDWVQRQGNRIDSLLENPIRGYDHADLIIKLADAYHLFDAVNIAGVYCPEVRQSALAGRQFCDVLNFQLGKDMNASVVRSIQARREAAKMATAAQYCARQLTTAEKGVSLHDVICTELKLVELDLSDGLASADIHIMSQKAQHAIYLLTELQHLTATLNQCEEVSQLVQSALALCESAVQQSQWIPMAAHVKSALEQVQAIPARSCKP